MNTYDLVIRNAMIHTMDRDKRVINRGNIAVQGDRIAWVGEDFTDIYAGSGDVPIPIQVPPPSATVVKGPIFTTV